MNLIPDELVDFLKEGKQLSYDSSKCECGRVVLNSADDLNFGVVWLDVSSGNEEAYVEIPAVSLLKSCEGYDPEFILLWLCNEKLFGTWDCDHWILRIFPNARWNDIADEPVKYLNAGWYDHHNSYSVVYMPTKKYTKIIGRPF